jgi:hypothetical protein
VLVAGLRGLLKKQPALRPQGRRRDTWSVMSRHHTPRPKSLLAISARAIYYKLVNVETSLDFLKFENREGVYKILSNVSITLIAFKDNPDKTFSD